MDGNEPLKPFKLPILPSSPADALLGKKITQEMIDSALSYDPAFRPSYVYLNQDSAHNNDGKRNGDTLGQITRTFVENGHVVAEVMPNRKYREGKFEELAAADGTHPGRSIDLWNKELIPGCKSDYYLEGIALCGATKPATVNLPAIYYSAETPDGILTFAIHTSSGDESMSDETKDQKVDFAAMQKQLDTKTKQIEQMSADLIAGNAKITALTAQLDHTLADQKKQAEQLATMQAKNDRLEIETLFSGSDYVGKIKPEEMPKLVELALALKGATIQLGTGESAYEGFLTQVKNRPVMVNLAVVGGHLPNTTSPTGTPANANAAITQLAAELKIDASTAEGFDKAELAARQKWPALFNVASGVK